MLPALFVNVIVPVPLTAVSVPPGHVSAGAGGLAITKPGGRVSVRLMPDMEVSAGAVTVIRRRLVCPGAIGLVWKDLASPTGRLAELITARSGLVLNAA